MNSLNLKFSKVSFSIGKDYILKDISFNISNNEKVCIVGKNGSGKSTLLNLIAGNLDFDHGKIYKSSNLEISMLKQNIEINKFDKIKDFLLLNDDNSTQNDLYRIAKNFNISFEKKIKDCSGGELRICSLVKALSKKSNVILLDEPTNHLDINSIEWLEEYLIKINKTILIISHDRRFINNICKRIFWINDSNLYDFKTNFYDFQKNKDFQLKNNIEKTKKLKKQINNEISWSKRGVSGRRKRNVGRLKNIEILKNNFASKLPFDQELKMNFSQEKKSVNKIIEAKKVKIYIDNKILINEFSCIIKKGDKIAVIGNNGSGKTTLIKTLIKEYVDIVGEIKLGSELKIAYFDQKREITNEDISLKDYITENYTIDAKLDNDQLIIKGKPRHIIGYLKGFLFSENRINDKISNLSGGEKARLMLASIMAKESNFLILDEPTNDLDEDTSNLLRSLIKKYYGTVIFVSHDRDFIDEIATSSIFINNKELTFQNGGYSFFKKNKNYFEEKHNKNHKNKTKNVNITKKITFRKKGQNKSNFLLKEIELITENIKKIEEVLQDINLFKSNKEKFDLNVKQLDINKKKLIELEDEWYSQEQED